jgi:hypothetical protein
MMSARLIIRRLALVLLAFVASAAAVLPVVILLMALIDPSPPVFDGLMLEYAVIAFVLLLVLTFFPALLVIAVAEWKRIRHWRYFTVAGGLIALLLLTSLGFMPGPNRHDAEAWPGLVLSGFLFVGGLLAGFVYWSFAGKASGALRDAWAARSLVL